MKKLKALEVVELLVDGKNQLYFAKDEVKEVSDELADELLAEEKPKYELVKEPKSKPEKESKK